MRRIAGWIIVALGVGSLLFTAASFATMGGLLRSGPGIAYGVVALVVGLLAFALPAALILVGWRLAHPRAMDADVAPRPHKPPVPPIAPSDVADLRVPVRACPDCGYLGIRMPTIGDGLWPGGGELGDRMVCPRCDWQGLPVSFEAREDYADFLRAIQPA